MKKILLALMASFILFSGSAFGFTLDTFSIYNPLTSAWVTALSLDWDQTGTGVAVGLGPYGSAIATDTVFTFKYEAFLANASNGSDVVIDADSGYTIVAEFTEKVSDGSVGYADTAQFDVVSGSWAIYYGGATANVLDGTGFDDGTLVASGSVLPANIDGTGKTTFTAYTDNGTGGGLILGLIETVNTAYLKDLSVGLSLPLFDLRFQGSIEWPPLDSNATAMFIGGDGTTFPDYPITSNDLVLKVDGSSKIGVTVIPEPQTALLFGLGLISFVGYCRKRKN